MEYVSTPLRASPCVLLCALPALADPSPAYLVKDINPQLASSFVPMRDLVQVGATAYFGVSSGPSGAELWKSDGTPAGTGLVTDLRPGPEDGFGFLLGPIGDAVVFAGRDANSAAFELWKSDGTPAGTVRIAAVTPVDTAERLLPTVNGAIYFAGGSASDTELWKTDGTPAGTQ